MSPNDDPALPSPTVEPPTEPRPHAVNFFARMPTGGTVYVPHRRTPPQLTHVSPSRFRQMPNGGGTIFRPGGEEGNATAGGENGDK